MKNPIEMSLVEMATALREGHLTAVAGVEAHIRRIEEVNPAINALATATFEAARAQAQAADAARASGAALGPLHGVPFTVKDCLESAGVRSSAGLKGRANHIPAHDAAVVARLKSAGAILMGKTTLAENCWTQETVGLLLGRTHNPHHLKHTVGGSSGGSAAMVAAGGTPLEIGSDIAGSIRLPAAFTGVVGLRPTSATLPEDGMWPPTTGRWADLEAVGPLTRRVEDAAFVFDILRGSDYQPLNPDELRGAKVAHWLGDGLLRCTPPIQDAIRRAVGVLEKGGMVRAEGAPSRRRLAMCGWLAYPTRADLRAFSDTFGNGQRRTPLGELVRHLTLRPEVHPVTLLFWLMSHNFVPLARLFFDGDRWRAKLREQVLALIGEEGVAVCPVHPTLAPRHHWNLLGIPLVTIGFQTWLNLAGLPGLTVPIGKDKRGLPVAVLVAGNAGRERQILNAGYAIQQALTPQGFVPVTPVAR